MSSNSNSSSNDPSQTLPSFLNALNALGEPVRPAWQRIPADIMSLRDYERHALHHVERASWAHIACGADQELSVAHNRAAFDALRLVPEPLPDLSNAHTRVDLLGRSLRSPILLAPVAYQRLMHPDGELATVRAAMAMQTAMIVSTLATQTIEDIAQAAESARRELGRGAPLYFQLYSQPERSTSLNLVRRAEAAGYEAIVWTVDANIKRPRLHAAAACRIGQAAAAVGVCRGRGGVARRAGNRCRHE